MITILHLRRTNGDRAVIGVANNLNPNEILDQVETALGWRRDEIETEAERDVPLVVLDRDYNKDRIRAEITTDKSF